MWQYNYTLSSDELYHHGIQGQKWGKRNGPPYPLGTYDRSAAERRLNTAKDNLKSAKKSGDKKKYLYRKSDR